MIGVSANPVVGTGVAGTVVVGTVVVGTVVVGTVVGGTVDGPNHPHHGSAGTIWIGLYPKPRD